MKYRKKPIVVDAIICAKALACASREWDLLPDWLSEEYEKGNIIFADDHISILTPEGRMKADGKDMIIRGVKGEIYPCKPDIFEMTYEPDKPQPRRKMRSER